MNSIFRGGDIGANSETSFWSPAAQQIESPASRVIQEGSLLIYIENDLKSLYFVLEPDRITVCGRRGGGGKESVAIGWKWLREVKAYLGGAEMFGFSLSGDGDVSEQFYTPDRGIAEAWVKSLRKYSLSTSFSLDYELITDLSPRDETISFATSLNDDSIVAVKKSSKADLAQSDTKLKRIMREITVLRTMAHPNVVKLQAVYEETDSVLILTEFVPGGDLLHRIRTKGAIDLQTVKEIAVSLLRGIQYIHQSGVIHRDIKLENILIDGNSCKIIDFGLAIRRNDDRGTMCGSPGYVAPEILRKQQYSEKVDIYSAGAVLFMLISGSTPFPGNTLTEILTRNKRSLIEFSGKGWREVPSQARNLVLRMMEADATMRVSATQALRHPWLAGGEKGDGGRTGDNSTQRE